MARRGFDTLLRGYEHWLRLALKHRPIVVWAFVGMVVLNALIFWLIPKGFMPSEDTGQIVGITQAPEAISFTDMVHHHQMLSKIIADDPNVQSYMSSIGTGNGVNSPNLTLNSGRFLIVLKPRQQRSLSADQVVEELRPKLQSVPGIEMYLQNPPTISIGGQVTKAIYQFTLSSPSMQDLIKSTQALQGMMTNMEGMQDINSDMQLNNLQVNIKVDRDKCSQLGVTMSQVEDALDSAYSARQISTIYAPTNEYWVIIEVAPRFYRNPHVLNKLYVRSVSGQLVPLSTIADITEGIGPLLINHLGQFQSATLSFNLKPGYSLSHAVEQIKQAAAKVDAPSVSMTFQGIAAEYQNSLQGLWALLAVAIFVIYIVLGILYESFIHPVTILSGLPSAGLGALLILVIFHLDLNIYGYLGLIMLIGIVKKNAIMMIDFALDAEREHGLSAEEAITQAALTRFRPIMMTTMASPHGRLTHRHGHRRRRRIQTTTRLNRCRRLAPFTGSNAFHYPCLLYLSRRLPRQIPKTQQTTRGIPAESFSMKKLFNVSGCMKYSDDLDAGVKRAVKSYVISFCATTYILL